jgi:hypothetical protein
MVVIRFNLINDLPQREDFNSHRSGNFSLTSGLGTFIMKER